MINEKKLDGFCFEEESPLLSYAQVMRICRLEFKKAEEAERESFENDPQYWYEQQKLQEELEEERLIEEAQLTDEERNEITRLQKRKEKLEELYKQLAKDKEKLEEKMAKVDLQKKALQ